MSQYSIANVQSKIMALTPLSDIFCELVEKLNS